MKNRALLLSLLGLISILSLPQALAKDKKALVREPEDSTTSWNRTPKKYGVGVSTLSRITGTPTALTGTVSFSPEDLIQGFFAVGGTNGLFQVGIGGLYKRTLVESEGTGLHAGGGLGLGNIPKPASATAVASTGGQIAFTLAAVGGIHVTLPQLPHLKIFLDAGPTLTVTDNATDFAVVALSPALGLSVLYAF